MRRITVNGNRGESVARGGEGADSYAYVARPTLVGGRLFWASTRAGISTTADGQDLYRICVTVCRAVLVTIRHLAGPFQAHEYDQGADATSDRARILYASQHGVFVADDPPPGFTRSYLLR